LAAAADEYIFDAMMEKFADPEYVPALLRRAASSNADAAAAKAELERLLGSKRDWEARLVAESDRDLEDTIMLKIKAVNAKIADARKRAAEVSLPPALRVLFGDSYAWDAESLELTLPALPPKPEDKPVLEEFARGFDLVRRWADLSIPARRGVVRDLMEVRLLPAGRGQRIPQRLSYRFR
jgi:hypothetical protein